MNDATAQNACQAVGVWPVRLIAGGVAGWSLWCSGDSDLLLARGGRVQVFSSPDALLAAVAARDNGLTPAAATALDPGTLWSILAAPAAIADLDTAAAWFSQIDRQATVENCDLALNALNMATDIAATAGDARLTALLGSEALSPVFDALTFGLTLLGDGSAYRDDPHAMASTITPEAVAAVAQVVELAAGHIEAR